MGVGTPSDILGAVNEGIDMFDCVMPTRSGRTGLAFTWSGKVNLKNSKYQNDKSPLDEKCEIRELNKYSKRPEQPRVVVPSGIIYRFAANNVWQSRSCFDEDRAA